MKKLVIILLILSMISLLGLSVYACEEDNKHKITLKHSCRPTIEPTEEPTEEPTIEPTEEPTIEPTEEPTIEPTEVVVVVDNDDDNNSDIVYESSKESLPKTGESDNMMIPIIGLIIIIGGTGLGIFKLKQNH